MISSTNFSAIKQIIIVSVLFCTMGCRSINISRGEMADRRPVDKMRPVIALLPVQNITGTKAPLVKIRQTLKKYLNDNGFATVDENTLNRFIKNHRMRYTGGVDNRTAKDFKSETGANTVFQTSLELYRDSSTPQISLTTRLTGTDNNVILWMDSVALSGNDTPGPLDLSMVKDPQALMQKAVEKLVDSLSGYIDGERTSRFFMDDTNTGFQSGMQYDSPLRSHEKRGRVAVAPFYNTSDRKYAGEIMALHFLKNLLPCEQILFIEPGEIRSVFLGHRIIMDDGISLVDADVLFQKLNVDYILTGNALDYKDAKGATGRPKVHFSVYLLAKETKEVVWGANSYNDGDDGVFLFGMGKISTAHALASQMTEKAIETLLPFFYPPIKNQNRNGLGIEP